MLIRSSTTSVAVTSGRPGVLPRISVLPKASPVTGTGAVICPAAIWTVAWTVATDGNSDTIAKVSPPAGAGSDRRSVICRASMPIVNGSGSSESVTVVVMGRVSGANPAAVAVTSVWPRTPPVTCGLLTGRTSPAGTKTCGEMVAMLGSALSK